MKEQISEQRLRPFDLFILPRTLSEKLGDFLADHDRAEKHPLVDFMRRKTIIVVEDKRGG